MKARTRALLLTPLLALGLCLNTAFAFELDAVRVGDGIHALIGPTTGRTQENHALKANFGIADTAEGTLLIDSGASREGAKLQAATIVPGHGSVASLAKAQADTGDHLKFVVVGVKTLADDMAGVDEAVAQLGTAPQFVRLANFDELHRGNVSRAYLRIEAAQ